MNPPISTTTSQITNQIRNTSLLGDNTLHVIRVCTNPVRYHSRYRLARQQEEEFLAMPNLKLYTVEAAFGDRQHEITVSGNPHHLLLRTNSEIWIKENLINLGVRYLLPKNWKYLAWIDADISFRDHHWAQEAMHQLQHFSVIQPWSDCADLGHHGNIDRHFRSFGSQHQKRIPKQMHPSQPYTYAHSGFAWACRRDFWENVGGLPDFCILGSADHHAAFAMIGEVKNTIHGKMCHSFFRKLYEWQAKALRITKKEVGFTPGRIEHFFHGNKNKRFYRERWEILVKNNFDPDTDLMYDNAGVIQLTGKPELEQDLRLYNRSRQEDGID